MPFRFPTYERDCRPLLFRHDPEWIHHRALDFLEHPALTAPFAPFATPPRRPELERKLWGLTFRNPIGLAAGFDKDARALFAWDHLGFGFAEVGTITPRPQAGNPRPRVFRLPTDLGLINRLGFPNEGAAAIARRLRRLKTARTWPSIPIGINIGKQKETPLEEAADDYLACFRMLQDFADFFVVNVSSPNTPGLRQLLSQEHLGRILGAIRGANVRNIPVLVKISPDMTDAQIADVLACGEAHDLAGIVATNTTLDKSSVASTEEGGLSGLPLRRRSTEVIRFLARETQGRLPIVGVGGIFTTADAREKLDAGAALLQIYTSFVYNGPLAVKKICAGL